jgi:hypothetical protein
MKYFIVWFLIIAACLGVNALIGSLCWPYVVNSWLGYFHKDAHIVWWQGMLISFVPGLGQLAIPLTIVTWLLMIFLN